MRCERWDVRVRHEHVWQENKKEDMSAHDGDKSSKQAHMTPIQGQQKQQQQKKAYLDRLSGHGTTSLNRLAIEHQGALLHRLDSTLDAVSVLEHDEAEAARLGLGGIGAVVHDIRDLDITPAFERLGESFRCGAPAETTDEDLAAFLVGFFHVDERSIHLVASVGIIGDVVGVVVIGG